MFEFAIYAAMVLIGCMTAIHYYFSDRVKQNINRAREEWCKVIAEFNVKRVRNFIETFGSQASPPYNELEKLYTEIYKKELETMDTLVDATRGSYWLDDSLKCFTITIILFLVAGILPYTPFSEYSFSVLLVGVITLTIAVIQIYRVMRYLLQIKVS